MIERISISLMDVNWKMDQIIKETNVIGIRKMERKLEKKYLRKKSLLKLLDVKAIY